MRCQRSLRIAWAALALFAAAPAYPQDAVEPAQPRSIDIASHVAEASQRFGLPEQWIYSVMRTESAGRIGAVSSAGAMGLMQLMPETWARQRARFGLGSDPFDPRDNIMAGTSYLREMYDSYGASGFLAAYNAGPGRFEDWRDRGRPLATDVVESGRHRCGGVPHHVTRDRNGQRRECGGCDDASQEEAATRHGNSALRWSQARWRAGL
jgi:soluble lytic murein transglycosylase-like protein